MPCTYLAVADAFTSGQCDRIVALAATGRAEPGPVEGDIQILRYEVGRHIRTWHCDPGRCRHDRRRISLSVELSDLADCDGGELEVVPDRVGRPRDLPRGGAQIFTSRSPHRVIPVTRGRRWSLVAWTGAPRARK